MIQLKLSGETSITFNFPESPKEWPLSRYIDYLVSVEKFDQWLKSEEIEGIDPLEIKHTAIKYKGRCIAEFLGLDMEDLLDVPLESVADFDDDAQVSIETLFNSIQRLIAGMSPVDMSFDLNGDYIIYKFNYKGVDYELDPIIISHIAGKEQVGLKFGHLIEILDRKKMIDELGSSEESELEDPTGTKRFTNYLSTIAVLSKQVGFDRPNSPDAFSRYVRSMINHFKDIDIQTAIDIDFFLSITIMDYENIQHIPSFLSHLKTLKSKQSKMQGDTPSKKKRPKKSGKEQDTNYLLKEQLRQDYGIQPM